MLCRELKVSLNSLLGWNDASGRPLPITHRQQLTWDEHLRSDLDHPTRTDHYLMQIAAILLADQRTGKIPDPNSLKLKFGTTLAQKIDVNTPHIPGCPRPIRDQADLDRISAKMFMAQVGAMGRGMGGPRGEGFEGQPHPKAVAEKQRRATAREGDR